MHTGRVFEIKRFAVHDGHGIRTTFFFKGCPLKCVWCHNPEGISKEPEIAYLDRKCVKCGECVAVCPNNLHKITDNGLNKQKNNVFINSIHKDTIIIYNNFLEKKCYIATLIKNNKI